MPDSGILSRLAGWIDIRDKFRHIILDLFIQADFSLLDKDHQGCGHGHGLGDGGQVEDHRLVHRLSLRDPLALSVRLSEDDLPFPSDKDDGSRKILAGDGVFKDAVEEAQLLPRY